MGKYEVVRESLEAIEKELSAVAERLSARDDYRAEQRAKRITRLIGEALYWLRAGVEAAETTVKMEVSND